MSDENNRDAELSRVSSELAVTQRKLDEERRKREEDARSRLEKIEGKLDGARGEILNKIEEVKLTYATARRLDTLDQEFTRKFDHLDDRINDQGRLIYMAMGGLVALQAAFALGLHFWK